MGDGRWPMADGAIMGAIIIALLVTNGSYGTEKRCQSGAGKMGQGGLEGG
jgi:hypothetical protein